jgi:Cysteine-rich secretory protein family
MRVPALTIGALIALSPMAGWSPAGAITGEEQAFLEAVNSSRVAAGLAPLTYSEELSALADLHSAQMASSGTIYHSTDLGSKVGTVYANWTRTGENVGKGGSVESIHAAMLASPTHAANIYGDYNLLGIGVETNPGGVLFVTEIFAKAVVESAPVVSSPVPVASAPVPMESAPVVEAAASSSSTESTATTTRKVSQARSSKTRVVSTEATKSNNGVRRHGPPEWANNERSGR